MTTNTGQIVGDGFEPVGGRSWEAAVRGYLSMRRSPAAIKPLDGLRGIAILLVLGRHGLLPFRTGAGAQGLTWPIGGWDAATVLVNGWMGVDLFFVLSGFLITHHILKRWGGRFAWSDLKSYLAKRLLRIVPAYYACLLVVALGWASFYPVNRDDWTWRLVYHLLFLQDYLGADFVAAFWSLGVEEKFYLAAPLLLIPLMRVRSVGRVFAILGVAAMVPMALRAATYAANPGIDSYQQCFWVLRSPAHLCFEGMVIGSLAAFVYNHRDQLPWLNSDGPAPRALFWTGAAIVGVLLVREPLLATIDWFTVTAMYTLLAAGFGCVLMGLVLDQRMYSRLFASRQLFFFSKISYSLYLVHMVFLGRAKAMVSGYWTGFEQAPVGVQVLVYLPVYAAVSIAAALVLHYLVEKPFLLLKDRV